MINFKPYSKLFDSNIITHDWKRYKIDANICYICYMCGIYLVEPSETCEYYWTATGYTLFKNKSGWHAWLRINEIANLTCGEYIMRNIL
jgi:hypothetical protein